MIFLASAIEGKIKSLRWFGLSLFKGKSKFYEQVSLQTKIKKLRTTNGAKISGNYER